jgi:sensor histidine kinase YesM
MSAMKKSVSFMFHLSFWIFTSLLVILIYQILSISVSILGGNPPSLKENFTILLIVLPIGAAIFYTSYFSLDFFLRQPRRFLWLGIGYVFWILIFTVPALVARSHSGKEFDFLEITLVVFPILYFNSFGFLFKTFIEWIQDRKIKAELERDKINSQLELLKSKINPHFLFNTLNNIDVLILDAPQKASDYLKKLSELLRFMLYESGYDKIQLETELSYITKYIELQKIRTSNPDFVTIKVTGNITGKTVAPMIFIHFIENAFKHATNKKIDKAIEIRFDINETNLSFHCMNYSNPSEEACRDKNGIGVSLMKQKLELIYKNAYKLKIKEEKNWYIVDLDIQFNDK